ncbi:flagellar hook-associated protein 1 FlgK [Paenibacillus forsythiae]|uniref:Flagellar hook-associated protein 1 n=1 Tax=Paenibacillus forsythiae TaxID=365616 RepID=A0ABU3HB26_9BACL|nr:flagellar hook-associated protein FlgK [Paenibacillus forsythiae]MDT3428014.1 flagellar hook-associated protein 1 FlgK [Paenibacillus forsythiae]
MTSTFHSIETARRSLFTQTAALNTTGHNIANANTEGYSRQKINMTTSLPIEAYGLNHSTVPGQLGTGVEFSSIERVRERFLDEQFRNENKSLGSWNVQYDTLDKLQTIINEPSDTGISTLVNSFWKSWSDLSKDPESITNRKIVKETTLALTDALNHTSKQLSDLSSDLTSNIEVNVSKMNTILTSIADLNYQINRIERLGDKANDLRDQRDLLTDELSKLANIQVTELSDGYQISMGGQILVTGQVITAATPETMETAFASGALNSGELYGTILSRDRYVSDYRQQLDQLANTLVNGKISLTIPAGAVLPEGTILNGVTYTGASRTLTSDLPVTLDGINALHKLGYALSNGAPLAGGDFFAASDGGNITAANITVSQDILDDPSLIATSFRTTGTGSDEKVVKGNNGLALLMADLKDTKFDFGDGLSSATTIDDYFKALVGQVGVQANEAKRQADNALILTSQVDSRRQSVSGVSLDEEMSNMIMFQHAYSAAARFMTTFDELLNKLINGTGVVGR